MVKDAPTQYTDVDDCVAEVIRRVGNRIVLALPLGLGKPCQFVNALYRRACEDPELQLKLVTALAIERPTPRSDLEKRFLDPLLERIFGDYPGLDYVSAVRNQALPPNVEVSEFFLSPGQYLNNPAEQQNYISSNYTHVARDLIDLGVNVCAQMISRQSINGALYYSLSCNPDVTMDLLAMMREQQRTGTRIAAVAQVNNNLPFMYDDAMVEPGTFDIVVDNPTYAFKLPGPPNLPVNTADHMIGLLASTLLKDGGTLQIGIGSLGDAIVHATLLRHQHNKTYQKVLSDSGIFEKFGDAILRLGGTEPFAQGLYGASEMFVSGFLDLYRGGVLKREVYPDATIQRLLNEEKLTPAIGAETLRALLEAGAIRPQLTEEDFDFLQRFGILKAQITYEDGYIRVAPDRRVAADLSTPTGLDEVARHCLGDRLSGGILMHGGFFLGPQRFYDELRNMPASERKKFCMASVKYINQLYRDPLLATLQRTDARFMNTAMMVTLTGAACSDGLENGQVVSGVGGQYNFVAMAHELPGARSALMLRSTRKKGQKVTSNILPSYGQITIPRHLRDLVITEYGIAELRGKSDKEVIAALLNITDSRFQEELIRSAKRAGKLPQDYRVPDQFMNNFPQRLDVEISGYVKEGFFPTFPLGTDFTAEEIVLGKTLKALKGKLAAPGKAIRTMARAIEETAVPEAAKPYLERLQLAEPSTLRERMAQKLIISELVAEGHI